VAPSHFVAVLQLASFIAVVIGVLATLGYDHGEPALCGAVPYSPHIIVD